MAAGDHWSEEENDAIVDAYVTMLTMDARREPFVKSRINARLQEEIGRSKGSIEYKFQNISAVLRDMQHPFVDGYKPASNYQDSLRRAVEERVQADFRLEQVLIDMLANVGNGTSFSGDIRITDAPVIEFGPARERLRRAAKRDYAAMEAAKRELGLAGEEAVVNFERRRLRAAGLDNLAAAVEHVSVTQGDGLGFDVLSFDKRGQERYIEVKTTTFGKQWPMIISRNEVDFSQKESERFSLYRLFDFRRPHAGLYTLDGDIQQTCQLDPTAFQALPHAEAG